MLKIVLYRPNVNRSRSGVTAALNYLARIRQSVESKQTRNESPRAYARSLLRRRIKTLRIR